MIDSIKLSEIDSCFWTDIKEAFLVWAKENDIDIEGIIARRMPFGWNEGQVIYQTVDNEGYHWFELSDDGMSMFYCLHKRTMLGEKILDKDLRLEIKLNCRAVPMYPLEYKKPYITTVERAKEARRKMIEIMSEPILKVISC